MEQLFYIQRDEWWKRSRMTWLMVSPNCLLWGLGNVVNNFSQQGISVVVLSSYPGHLLILCSHCGAARLKSQGKRKVVSATGWRRLLPNAWSLFLQLGLTGWCIFPTWLKSHRVLIPLGWAIKGNGDFELDGSIHWIVILSLLIFGAFLYLSTKGLSTLKVIGGHNWKVPCWLCPSSLYNNDLAHLL